MSWLPGPLLKGRTIGVWPPLMLFLWLAAAAALAQPTDSVYRLGPGDRIIIKVFGEDPAILQQKSQEVLRTVSAVRGIARAFIDRAGEIPQLHIEIDRQNTARYGLNVADIQDLIEMALGGKGVCLSKGGGPGDDITTR